MQRSVNAAMKGKTDSTSGSETGYPGPPTLSDLEWLDEQNLISSEALDELYKRVEERLEREGKLPVEEEPDDSDGVDALASDDPMSLAEVEWLGEHSGVDPRAVDVLAERVKERLLEEGAGSEEEQEEEGGSAEEPDAPDGGGEPAPDAGGKQGAGKKTSSAAAPSASRAKGKPAKKGPRATKEAEELAEEKELDLTEVEGTGLHGKIKKGDVEKKLEEKEASTS
jgi:pyruvate/2-oxoglutarate dehydrogenase complex dihydrolipoamide acyltransferase (E2) component